MFFTDRATVNATRRTADGYLAADARIARTGIQVYSGAEVGRPDLASVRVFRSPEAVFDDAARTSAAHKPITIDHPAENVTASNWRSKAVGWSGDTIAKDGDYLRVPMMLADQAAISAVESGKRELSCGYSCDLDWTAGVHDGQPYDARQTGIRINHIALVAAGRAGSECRIGDSAGLSLRDAGGQPIRLIDRDSGGLFKLDADRIAAIETEAGKAGLGVDAYVRDVLRLQPAPATPNHYGA